MATHQSHVSQGGGREVDIGRVLSASTLSGDKVRNTQGEDLGDIKDLMIDTREGAVRYAVVSYGGWLGMGNKLFAVPWTAFRLDTEHHCLVLDVPKERLKNAPGFDKDNWPDFAAPEFGETIHSYYRSGASPLAH